MLPSSLLIPTSAVAVLTATRALAILSSPSSAPDGLTATEALAPSESSVKQVSLVRDVLGEFLSGRIIKDAATALQ